MTKQQRNAARATTSSGPPSPAQLNERIAWALLRAVPPGAAAAGAPVRVHHDPDPAVWLQVHASGAWEAACDTSPAARDLLDLLLPVQLRADLVIGQAGQSLDGRIATAGGDSRYVTGPADIRRLHRLRALVDAVVVGAGTVAADDPRLTVREVAGRNPARVVLDPAGRLGAGRRMFRDGAAPTLVIRRAGGGAPAAGPAGCEVLRLPAERGAAGGGFAPAAVVRALRARGYRRLLIEGGGATVSRFLQAGALDRLHVTVAPLLIGSGPPALTLDPIDSLSDALRPRCRRFPLGDDVLFDLDLRAG